MQEIDLGQQPRSARSAVMIRFWHAEGVIAEEAREKVTRNSTRANKNRAIISKMVFPLALRGATTEEIHKIQGIKPSQINNALTKIRANGSLPRPTEDETRRAKKLAHLKKRVDGGYMRRGSILRKKKKFSL